MNGCRGYFMDWLYYERTYGNGKKLVCGVDEAGRGPLAGRVYAAAVIMPSGVVLDGVNDSKKLAEKTRKILFEKIKEAAISYSIAWASEQEIYDNNILKATFLAMKRAVDGLKIAPEIILVDGNGLPDFGIEAHAIIKGDSLSHSIAAASILAKVARDEYMLEEAKKYPEYFFERHKGYGTKLHIEMLMKYGPCAIHRKGFLRKILNNE